jgi:hypothetical protein
MSIELLKQLVDQIDKCKPIDDHGHDFRMNKAFINAKDVVAMAGVAKFEEPSYRRKSWFDDDGQFGVGA